MLRPEPGLSRDQLIEWAKTNCGDGTISSRFNVPDFDSEISVINDEDLKTIAYIPEANRCATRVEINQQAYKFENTNNRKFLKTESDGITYTPFTIRDETIKSFLGEIPKPVVIPIYEINNLDDFDFDIFKPIIIKMEGYVDEGVSLSSLPDKKEDEYPPGAVKCAEDILYEGTKQLTLDEYGSNYVKSIRKIKSDLINGQQGLREGLA